MDQYAFAITTCGQHYQVKESADLDTLFDQAKLSLQPSRTSSSNLHLGFESLPYLYHKR